MGLSEASAYLTYLLINFADSLDSVAIFESLGRSEQVEITNKRMRDARILGGERSYPFFEGILRPGTDMATHRCHTRELRPTTRLGLVLALCCMMLTTPACRHRGESVKYLGQANSAQYLNQATQIAYTDLEKPISPKVDFATPPRRISDRRKDEVWDVTLDEAIQTALLNSQVIRTAGQFLSPGNPLLANPDFVTSVYDPAIQESGVLFGRRGVEAALSDFDTQFTTQLLYGRNETIQNNTIALGRLAGEVLDETSDTFSTTLQKRLATGGQLSLSHSINHTGRNIPSGPGATQLFTTVYEGNFQFQFRQPLLAGGGAEYTRIAGPISANIQGVTGVQQGVIIARIENDMELADFERDVQQLVHDVEQEYWQLHLSYLAFDLRSRTTAMVQKSLEVANAKLEAGTGLGGRSVLTLRSMLLDSKGQTTTALNDIYASEARLRRLMGLPVNDGRVIRPIDSPVSAEIQLSWEDSLSDALVKRPEIRRQKWSIRSLELQLRAAENLLMPRLDFVSSYRLNGYGDDLFGTRNDNNPLIPNGVDHFYESITSADEPGWNFGFEFSVPIGRRFAKTQVQSLELQLAKARAVLEEQEVEISHEVADVFRRVDNAYAASENAYNQYLVADEARAVALALFSKNIDSDPELEQLLRAEMRSAQAELQMASALTEYNSNLADLHLRTGRTLRANNVHLMEGPWCQDAYIDANEEFEARRHARPVRKPHRVSTEPYIAPDYRVID